MTPELEDKLRELYPSLFNRMVSGYIECGDGWYALIKYICKRLEYENLKLDDDNKLHFDQIKEKFGTLRVYTNLYTDSTSQVIDTIEGLSAHICEECGRPGNLSSHYGWIRTRCNDHEPKDNPI